MARILAALSGGVDSSVAAALLVEQGHEVVGAYMKNWINEDEIAGHCPWQEDIEDARKVADQLGIDFRVVNLIDAYKDRVVSYLLKGYEDGVTPNPDVMCNREMKFGVFLDHALADGFTAVATGHYAIRRDRQDGTADIYRGLDHNKDQSYFLALLRQHQARHALFPIGEMTKPEVRRKAESLGLATARKKDSQGICFIGEVKMKDFLRHYVPDRPGRIIATDGSILGTHHGLHFYTLGQRKGIGIPSNTFGEAYVVVEKRGSTNELVVAFDREDSPGLFAARCTVGSLSFVSGIPDPHCRIGAQPRYRTADFPADFIAHPDGRSAEVVFDEPQRALTPGQICAFYQGDRLVGGGIFETIYHGPPATTPAR